MRPAVFTAESPEQVFTLRDPGVWERATSDLRSGLWPIWTGFDHRLFLVCLLLPGVLPAVGVEVLKIVTAFTLAHSSSA